MAQAPAQSATSAPTNGATASSRPSTTEIGVSGTPNYSGQLLAESAAKLQHTQAFGSAGSQTWGEWERIARTNPYVNAGLEFVMAAIRDARLDFDECEENPESEAQVEFLQWSLDNCKPGRAEFLSQAGRGALTFGFALHEMVAAPVEHEALPGGRGYAVARLCERLPSSVRADGWIEEDGQLVTIRQLGPRDMGRKFETVDLPASKCLLTTWNQNGNNWAGFSAFRPVHYLCLQQEEIIRILGIGISREALGVPVVEPAFSDAEDLTKEQRDAYQTLVQNLTYHENAGAVMAKGWKMSWLYSAGANKTAVVQVYEALGRIILSQVGAQQIDLGTGATGSRSVGEVHQSSAEAFIQGVCSVLERVLEKLVKTSVDWNWPETKPGAYPKPKLTLKKAKLDPKTRFEAMKLAKDAGLLTVTAADESAAREELGLSPLDPGERDTINGVTIDPATGIAGAEKAQDTALNGAQVTAAQGIVEAVAAGRLPRETGIAMLVEFFNIPLDRATALFGEVGGGFEPTTPAPVAPDGPGGSLPPPAAGASTSKLSVNAPGMFVPRRPLRPSEQHLDLAAMSDFLDVSREAFERDVKPIAASLIMRTLPGVKAAMKDRTIASEEIAALDLDGAELDAAVSKFLEQCRAEGYRQVRNELRKSGAFDATDYRKTELRKSLDGFAKLLRALGDLGLVAPKHLAAAIDAIRLAEEEQDDKGFPVEDGPSEAQQEAQDALAATQAVLTRKIKNRLRADIEAAALHAVLTNGTPEDVVVGVMERQISTGAFKSDAGTVITRAFSIGREEMAQEFGDRIESVELSAVLDQSTCTECESLDGTEMDFNSEQHDSLTPPLSSRCSGGDNCRCLLIYRIERTRE